jgi:MFS family permease
MINAEKSVTAHEKPQDRAELALRDQAPPPKLLVPVLVLAAFGLYLASLAPQIITLAIRIAGVDPDGKTIGLSAVLLAGAVVSIVSLPVFGALSDRTQGRLGRRRPWFVGGAVAGLVGLLIAGAMPSVAGVAIGWGIASLGYGAAFAGFLPLIPEFVPDHLRARLSGLIGFVVSISVLVGVFLGSTLVTVPVLMLALPGVVGVLTTVVLAVVVRKVDRPLTADWPRFGLREFLGSYWLRTDGDRDFAWNWVSRFLLGLAYVAVQSYATFFLTDTVGLSVADAAAEYAKITAISTPIAVVCFLLSGYLSDRLGRRKAFVCVGAVIIAVALVIAAVTQSLSGFLIAWLVLTIGQAIYLTVDIAIAAAVVPDDAQAGKAMSVYQVATLLPNVGAPVVAIAVLTISGGANYSAFFVVLAVLAVLSALAALRIRRIR